MVASTDSINQAGIAARAASDKLAEDIRVLDVSQQVIITDCFVICTGDNERHVNSIVDEIEAELSDKAGVKPKRREGQREGRWVLLDYGSIVIHVQRREERGFYALDRLWWDAPVLEIEGVESANSEHIAAQAEQIERDVDSVEDLPLAGPTPDHDEI